MKTQCLPCAIPSFLYVAHKNTSDITIDVRSKTVTRDGKVIPLTQKEFKLLSLLYSEIGKVFNNEEILAGVWGYDFDPGTNAIQVYINFLRNKVDRGFEKKLICTKPGFGYYLST